MVYPSVIMTFAMIVVIALVTFLVPVFEGVFKQFGGDLPPITKATVMLSNALKGEWWAFIAVTVGTTIAFRKFKRSEWGRPKWDAFRLKVPMKIGTIVQKVALARWSRTLSALVSAGVPLLAALDITAKTAGNHVVEKAMSDVIESVKRGGTIAEPLRQADIFPGMVAQMVAVGEETGALDGMLSKIADFYEDQVEAAVKSLTSILEPIMLVVVGGIVGFIVVSMYLPLFKVYDSIK
jgi:type IV pilus assembly protein PilC